MSKHVYFVSGNCTFLPVVMSSENESDYPAKKSGTFDFQIVVTCIPTELFTTLRKSLVENRLDVYVKDFTIKQIYKLD